MMNIHSWVSSKQVIRRNCSPEQSEFVWIKLHEGVRDRVWSIRYQIWVQFREEFEKHDLWK